MLALFVAIGAAAADTTRAQQVNIPEIFRGATRGGYEEGKVYQDERGSYHYETRERRVWVPEQRTRGIFGTRVEPGHYETIREQVKIYHNRNNNRYGDDDRYNNKRSKKGHPHGMPPGQRKKLGNRDYDDRYDDRRYDDRRYDKRVYDDRRYVDRRN